MRVFRGADALIAQIFFYDGPRENREAKGGVDTNSHLCRTTSNSSDTHACKKNLAGVGARLLFDVVSGSSECAAARAYSLEG